MGGKAMNEQEPGYNVLINMDLGTFMPNGITRSYPLIGWYFSF